MTVTLSYLHYNRYLTNLSRMAASAIEVTLAKISVIQTKEKNDKAYASFVLHLAQMYNAMGIGNVDDQTLCTSLRKLVRKFPKGVPLPTIEGIATTPDLDDVDTIVLFIICSNPPFVMIFHALRHLQAAYDILIETSTIAFGQEFIDSLDVDDTVPSDPNPCPTETL